MNNEIWASLLLLPGVGLLILSTAARYTRLHEEMHHISNYAEAHRLCAVERLVARARLFRNALFGLYLAAAMLAIAPLMGSLLEIVNHRMASQFMHGLTACAIVCVVFACFQLIRESARSLDVICEHSRQVREQSDT